MRKSTRRPSVPARSTFGIGRTSSTAFVLVLLTCASCSSTDYSRLFDDGRVPVSDDGARPPLRDTDAAASAGDGAAGIDVPDLEVADAAAGDGGAVAPDARDAAAVVVTRADATAPTRDAQVTLDAAPAVSDAESAGEAGVHVPVCGSLSPGTLTRPQLSAAEADGYTLAKYFEKAGRLPALTADPWDPTAGVGDVALLRPDFTVASDGSGTHQRLQDAIDDARGAARRYILVKPGRYEETVTVSSSTPITIYGADPDASQVVIFHDLSSDDAGGTAESAAVTVEADFFQAKNLTIANSFAPTPSSSNIQAVALYTTADKVILDNVRLLSFMDTLYLDSPTATSVSRVYVRNSFIEGDTDLVFGRATAVIERSDLHYISTRKGTAAGIYLAPSTAVANPYGFLISHCQFTSDATAPANRTYLGRSWDRASTTSLPNGQVLIRESVLGAHINTATPWAAAASSLRPFSASGNRLNEFCNSGPGAP